MKFKNEKTGHIVENFEYASCSGFICGKDCPVKKKANEGKFPTCGEYAAAHKQEAFALLGYYPMEDQEEKPEKKPRFRFEDYPGKYAMHVKTEVEAEQFCIVMDNAGRSWADGTSYAGDSEWYNDEGEGLCYFFNDGQYRDYGDHAEYVVLEYSDFDWSQGPEPEPEPEKKPEKVKPEEQEEEKVAIHFTLGLNDRQVVYLLQASVKYAISGADYLVKLLQKDMEANKE